MLSAVGDRLYIAKNERLLITDTTHGAKLKLPAELVMPPASPSDPSMSCGSAVCGTIPSAHVVGNGATVLDRLACFVSVRNAQVAKTHLACFDTVRSQPAAVLACACACMCAAADLR